MALNVHLLGENIFSPTVIPTGQSWVFSCSQENKRSIDQRFLHPTGFILLIIPLWAHIPGPASLSEVAPMLFSFQQQTHRCPYLHHSLLLLFAVGQKVISIDQISTMHSIFRLPAKLRPASSVKNSFCCLSAYLTFWFILHNLKEQSLSKAVHSWDKGC